MTHTTKRILRGISITVAAIVLLGVAGPLIPYKTVDVWVCPITGSTKIQVTSFGCFTHQRRTTSALEQWLERREPSFQPPWQHISRVTYCIFSHTHACRAAPESYPLRLISDGLVSTFSDERLADLIDVLRHGSHEERRRAVQSIIDDYFARE